MADIAPAPAPAPTAPAAPSQGEVPITPSTVPPQPIGSQAPPAPVGDVKGQHHPQSRREATREAVKKAFERTTNPGPANARMGHNRPPEPMDKEKATRPPPIDLKKRPSEQPQEMPRGDHGHFAPRSGAAAATDARGRPQAGQAASSGRPAAPYNVVTLPHGAPYAQPPKVLSPRSQAEWGAAPESVRGAVTNMHKSFRDAWQRSKPARDVFKSIAHYHNMAASHGTTLAKALDNYVGMENKLRSDPVGGLDVIVNNLNLRTPEGQRITLADIAYHVLSQTPEQRQLLQSRNAQMAQTIQLQQMQQQQAAIAQNLQKLHYERQFVHTRGAVDRFAEANPRLDELGPTILRELKLGFDLPTAYRRAELLHPATQAAQTRTQTAQTRSSDRSIHGAPDSGSTLNGKGRQHKPVSRRDAVAHAIKQVRGSL